VCDAGDHARISVSHTRLSSDNGVRKTNRQRWPVQGLEVEHIQMEDLRTWCFTNMYTTTWDIKDDGAGCVRINPRNWNDSRSRAAHRSGGFARLSLSVRQCPDPLWRIISGQRPVNYLPCWRKALDCPTLVDNGKLSRFFCTRQKLKSSFFFARWPRAPVVSDHLRTLISAGQ